MVLPLQVKFVGEEAVDEGGPKREFWRVLGEEIRKHMCAGDNEKLCLEHDVVGLQVHNYLHIVKHAGLKPNMILRFAFQCFIHHIYL